MLLFQYKKQEDENPDYLQYKYFSLRKRAFTLAKPKTIPSAIKKKMMEADLESTKLQSLENENKRLRASKISTQEL